MFRCKKCNSVDVVKNGIVRKKQRYRCNNCGFNFVHSDNRTNEEVAALKALTALLTSLGTDSPRKLGRLIGRDPSIICRWQYEIDLDLGEPAGASSVDADFIGIDAYFTGENWWDDVEETVPIFESSKPVTVSAGKLPSGLSVMIIAQRIK